LDIQGVYSVLPTAFQEDGSLDLDGLRRVVDAYIGAGVNGLTALGVTSEVARLTEAERGTVLETVLEQADGRVPVVAGTSADGQRLCLEYSRAAIRAGASAIMVSPPRMPKLNSDAVVKHYAGLASALDVPIVVQDYPPVSGYSMEPVLLARIAREVSSARTIKLEDPPTPFKTARILEHAQGLKLNILGGLGGVFLLEELMSGAAGVMTGFAYPEVLVRVVQLWRAGEREQAAAYFYGKVALMRFEFQEGIGMSIRKEMLRRRGILHTRAIRPPGALLDAQTSAALDQILAWAFGKAQTL
jgi:4-hydroxy-tetrahydrodipicolinate synthase